MRGATLRRSSRGTQRSRSRAQRASLAGLLPGADGNKAAHRETGCFVSGPAGRRTSGGCLAGSLSMSSDQWSTHGVELGSRSAIKRFRGEHREQAEREWRALTLLARYAPGLAPEPREADLEAPEPTVVMSRLPGGPCVAARSTAGKSRRWPRRCRGSMARCLLTRWPEFLVGRVISRTSSLRFVYGRRRLRPVTR